MTRVAISFLRRGDISRHSLGRGETLSDGMTSGNLFWKSRTAVGVWLLSIAAIIMAMVTIGGLTRLTGSGLSITQWDPIMGAIPPLNDAAWAEAFAKYRQIPQYLIENRGMSLEGFKGIFWW